jgi:hypothetical protein
MKHMLNLLVLLSLSFAAQAGPGGPAIDDEGETTDVKASAAVAPVRRPATPPAAKRITHADFKKLRELGAIIKMVDAVKDVNVLGRVLKYLFAEQDNLQVQVDNPKHYNFKAIKQMAELIKTANAEERAIYDAIEKHLDSFGAGKASEKLEYTKTIFDTVQDASIKLAETPHFYE